ncbi:SCF ubiquitin ligase complex subunit [Rhodotorula kratochvilovae]
MADWSTTQMICPIAHLPNELLVEIVEHLEDPYSGRRSDLYNACLVSKQFARVAQSILWRTPWNRWGEHGADPVGYAVTLMRTAATAARAVKSLTLRYLAADVPLRLEALAAELPNVEHLRLHAVGRVDMTEVALFSNLSRLYIYSVDVSLSDPVFFPRLASLSFESAGLVSYLDSEWAFEAATLPALRHLRFECCRVSADEGPGWPYRIPHLRSSSSTNWKYSK